MLAITKIDFASYSTPEIPQTANVYLDMVDQHFKLIAPCNISRYIPHTFKGEATSRTQYMRHKLEGPVYTNAT